MVETRRQNWAQTRHKAPKKVNLGQRCLDFPPPAVTDASTSVFEGLILLPRRVVASDSAVLKLVIILSMVCTVSLNCVWRFGLFSLVFFYFDCNDCDVVVSVRYVFVVFDFREFR